MVAIDFKTGRQRPARLSNQNCCYSNATVRAIDKKAVGDLSWSDFETIFPISGCTAEYDEQVYFLPHALNYLLEHPYDGNEFLTSLVYFVSQNANRLHEEGLLEPSIEGFWSCFQEWTQTFEIVHFDEPACRAKGWGISHFDYVKNSDVVRDLLESLVRYIGQHMVAERMVQHLFRPGHRAEDSAWLLEIAREQRSGYAYYSAAYPGKEFENTPTKFSRICEIVTDTALLQRALDEIRDTLVPSAICSIYWMDLADELELAV